MYLIACVSLHDLLLLFFYIYVKMFVRHRLTQRSLVMQANLYSLVTQVNLYSLVTQANLYSLVTQANLHSLVTRHNSPSTQVLIRLVHSLHTNLH